MHEQMMREAQSFSGGSICKSILWMTLVPTNVYGSSMNTKLTPEGKELMYNSRVTSDVGEFLQSLDYQHRVGHINERDRGENNEGGCGCA